MIIENKKNTKKILEKKVLKKGTQPLSIINNNIYYRAKGTPKGGRDKFVVPCPPSYRGGAYGGAQKKEDRRGKSRKKRFFYANSYFYNGKKKKVKRKQGPSDISESGVAYKKKLVVFQNYYTGDVHEESTPYLNISSFFATYCSLIFYKKYRKKMLNVWRRSKFFERVVQKKKKRWLKLNKTTSKLQDYQLYSRKIFLGNKLIFIGPRWESANKKIRENVLLRTISVGLFLEYSCHLGKFMEIRNRPVYPYLLYDTENGVIFNPYLMMKEIRVMIRMIQLRTFWHEIVAVNVPLRDSDDATNSRHRKKARGHFNFIDRWVGGLFSNYKHLYRRGRTLNVVNTAKPYKVSSRLRNSLLQLLAVKRFPQVPSIFIGFDIDHWPINEVTRLGLFTFMFIDSDYNGESASIIIPFNLSRLSIGIIVNLIVAAIKAGRMESINYASVVKGMISRGEREKVRKKNFGYLWNKARYAKKTFIKVQTTAFPNPVIASGRGKKKKREVPKFSGWKARKRAYVSEKDRWRRRKKPWDPFKYMKVVLAHLVNRKSRDRKNVN